MAAGAVLVAGCIELRAEEPAQVRSRIVALEYLVNEDALPLREVGLWYTRDRGQTWHFFGHDPDASPPIQFDAPEEGLYGFYLILTNGGGASGPDPVSGVDPHFSVFIDYTPPIVQLHTPTITTLGTRRLTLSIRWSAIDQHFSSRPVQLGYRTASEEPWQSITGGMSNTGRFDWPVPDGLEGDVDLRITVTDQGGNSCEATTTVEVAPARPEPAVAEAKTLASQTLIDPSEVDQVTRKRARKLHQQGLWYRDRGERKMAMARLRSALALDPTMTYALVDLADLLEEDGDIAAAEEAYQLLLGQDANLRPALIGFAGLAVKKREYQLAMEYLHRIVDKDPKDVESWLNLGDIAIYRGDELAARDYYENAAKQDPTAKDVIARAQLRLADIAGLSRQYRDKKQVP